MTVASAQERSPGASSAHAEAPFRILKRLLHGFVETSLLLTRHDLYAPAHAPDGATLPLRLGA